MPAFRSSGEMSTPSSAPAAKSNGQIFIDEMPISEQFRRELVRPRHEAFRSSNGGRAIGVLPDKPKFSGLTSDDCDT